MEALQGEHQVGEGEEAVEGAMKVVEAEVWRTWRSDDGDVDEVVKRSVATGESRARRARGRVRIRATS